MERGLLELAPSYRMGRNRPYKIASIQAQAAMTCRYEERGFTGNFDIDEFTVELEEVAHQAVCGGGNHGWGARRALKGTSAWWTNCCFRKPKLEGGSRDARYSNG